MSLTEAFVVKNCILSIVILFSVMQLFSCRGASVDSSSTVPTTEVEDDQPKAVDNDNGFYVQLETTSKYSYVLHKGTGAVTDDFSQGCQVLKSDTGGNTDITCVVEAKEFDLYFYGTTLRVNVPEDMCQYFTVQRPYYYNFVPSYGPTIVIDNTIGPNPVTLSGITANPGEIKVGPNTQTSAYCSTDYTNKANPAYVKGAGNCCQGKYTAVVVGSDGSLSSASDIEWGGSFSSCLVGPALQDDGFTPASPSTGYPTTSVFFVEGEGYNQAYKVQSPFELGYQSNIYAANFFKPAEHPVAGGVPSCYRGYTVPAAGSVPTYSVPATNPYHVYTCYDRASEVKARIRVMVRDWNEVSEYELGAAGDSDSAGVEPDYSSPAVNDFMDLLDLGDVLAPASTSFPREIPDK